jgi:hypothetical protein
MTWTTIIVAGTSVAILLAASYVWGMNRGQRMLKIEYVPGQSLDRRIKTFEHQGKAWGCYELEQ